MLNEKVASRIAAHIASFRPKYDRMALRYLFSALSALEQIAVFAAERGDCIVDQLEDEIVHRDTCYQIAEICGGYIEPDEATQNLIDYLQRLEGDASIAILNVVAEGWLETVFDHLAETEIAPEVLRVFEEEEHRHSHDARALAIPDPSISTPLVADIEQLLLKVVASAQFMLPLYHLMGIEASCRMGLALCSAHREACKHLGVPHNVRKLESLCRGHLMLQRTAPYPVPLTAWDRSKFNLWSGPAPQMLVQEVRVSSNNGAKIQAQVIAALGRIYQRHPELARVCRGRQIYQVSRPIIGMRTLWDDDQVMTIGVHTKGQGWRRVLMALNRRTKRAREREYQEVPLLGDLIDFIPPSRCVAVVSYNGNYGGDFGSGPLSAVEGVPTLITIGKPDELLAVKICVVLDHRVGDGKHIGLLASELKRELSGSV